MGAALPAFPELNELFEICAPTATHPFWQGSSVINIKFEMSDGTEKIMQMSRDYAKCFAKALLKSCGE